ncbi:MAG: FtsX-like permease family protein [Vicinamibacterales bacterium]
MTLWHLAWRSLVHHRRGHAAVALGVAAAVAVLAGSLLVGRSVRESLAAMTAWRLGRAAVVIGSETPFPESLATRLGSVVSDPSALAPIFTLRGTVRDPRSGAAANVQVYGVDRRFFALHGLQAIPPSPGDVMFSGDLADELPIGGDDEVVLRVTRPTDIPLDSLHGRKDEPGRAMRLRYVGALDREGMGEFSLTPDQGPVRAVFVALAQVQDDLEQAGRVNTILVAGEAHGGASAAAVRTALASTLTATDMGLTFDAGSTPGTVIVEARAGLVPDRLARAVTTAAGEADLATTPVLSWLATRLTVGARMAPYSLVTAIGPDAGGDATLAALLAGAPADPPPIVLNDWTARDLGATAGDALDLEYYRWADEGRLVTDRARFRVAGVVPITGVAADRRLAPDYPGISDANSLADWTPPFPIDLRLVRPLDEDYWNRHRATPKAFIPITTGQALWRTRYGQLTSLRLRPAQAAARPDAGTGADVAARVAERTARAIDPIGAGFGIADVRTRNLAASVGATDFGQYFSYFSFFLVVSAVLLAALFFRLGIEQRMGEIGLLRAEGFPLRAVRRLFLLEGSLVAVAGAALGAALAVGWAGLMMFGLRTWWVGAVGTTDLALHVDAASLAIGAAMGVVAAVASIALSVRGLSRHSPRALLTGSALGAASAPARRSGPIAIVCLGLAIALSATSWIGMMPAAGGFFGAGALALIGGLAAFRRWLGRRRPGVLGARGTAGLVRLGLENASWRPGRSVTSAALVASAVFLLVSVDAFRKGPDAASGPASGTGGFALIGETALPFVHDPSTPEGREALGLSVGASDPDLAGVTFVAARLRPGEDASCLNLYQPKQPRVVGLPEAFLAMDRFRFGATLADTDDTRAHPWRLLGPADADGVVPAVVDATSLEYVLHAGVGDVITIDEESSRPVRLRIVGALADSMLQGEILVHESAFLALYPDVPGYSLLFVDAGDASPERVAALAPLVEDRMDVYGLDVQDSARRLEAFHRVENTYLSTFQTLGGLGLVLGSLGLVAVVLRNVLERRRELALLGAAGYTGGDLQVLVLSEHLALVGAGLVVGIGAAVMAIVPVLASHGALPALPLVWIAIVAATGLVASLAATRGVRRLPLVPALRSE